MDSYFVSHRGVPICEGNCHKVRESSFYFSENSAIREKISAVWKLSGLGLARRSPEDKTLQNLVGGGREVFNNPETLFAD